MVTDEPNIEVHRQFLQVVPGTGEVTESRDADGLSVRTFGSEGGWKF